MTDSNIKERWYNQIFVQFEIVKQLQNKELCFIGHDKRDRRMFLRFLICHKIDTLQYIFNRIEFIKLERNMYHSVANINREVPILTFNLRERKESKEYKDFNDNYDKYIIGYDYFVDFDGKEDFKKCHIEAKLFKQILDSYELPYYIINSSKKGFHFIIPNEYFENFLVKKELNDRTDLLLNISKNIKSIYEFSCMDTSVFDTKRVKKLPYSYVHDNSIVLPLSDSQFNNFNEVIIEPEYILINIMIKNRGLLTRTHNKTQEELKQNVKKFIEDFK